MFYLQMGKRLKGWKKEAIMMVLILLVLIKVQVGEPNPPSLPPTPLPVVLSPF
jgi:hypothetical protein